MRPTGCPTEGAEICGVDNRRPLVRSSPTLAGVDYIEVQPDGITLCVHFFGALPKNLTEQNVAIEGGARIRDIRVVSARFHEHDDGDLCLLIRVDRKGDFSNYCLCLVAPTDDTGNVRCSYETPAPARGKIPDGIDPRYACASFSFRIDRASTLDCKPEPCPPVPRPQLPAIDYLARDYESFRRLLFDRLSQTMPQWKERHAPDLGVTLVELFAYVADHLSYQLDSVGTEAFLRTARRRISVKRHARLVDYWMHEGSNARAWVAIESNTDLTMLLSDLVVASVSDNNAGSHGGVIEWRELQYKPGAVFFEPIQLGTDERIKIIAAHSEIQFYSWGREECCLPAGSMSATLYDSEGEGDEPHLRLDLKAGDFLIFEEVRGRTTGAAAYADPARRHVVRLTSAIPAKDPLKKVRIWEIEWHGDDALPFDLLLSVRTPAPECKNEPAAVARGNVVLVDHGLTTVEKDTWVVDVESSDPCCLCDGANSEQQTVAKPLSVELSQRPVTHAEPVAKDAQSAVALMSRDVRAAIPAVWLDEAPSPDGITPSMPPQWEDKFAWHAARDSLACGAADTCFAVEIDDEGIAHLRFGDGVNGKQPQAGSRFRARLRVGNGLEGNVGRDSIVWMARKQEGSLSGVQLRPRNPLPGTGGVSPESIEHAKLYAPHAYGRVLERAVTASDYAQLAGDDPRVQGAFAELAWTASWYEASVSMDTVARYTMEEVSPQVFGTLDRARRIGHDLRLVAARRVPLEIEIEICVEPGHLRGDVEKAAHDILSNRILPNGTRSMFHADELRFGEDIAASRLIGAVQAIDGVAHAEVKHFSRLYDATFDAERSLADNVIAITPDEIAQLEGDANFPERGVLKLKISGGR